MRVCVCNLSNFTLIKFPCKRQHFRKKPSGWVNVMCVIVLVSLCVCRRVDSTQISNRKSRGMFEHLKGLLTHTLGHTHAYIPIPLLTVLQPNEVICHWLIFVFSGLPGQTVLCVSLIYDYALFLLVSPSVSIYLSASLFLFLSNLCVVVRAGADRPRDGI